jgi:hypothetical protein
MSPPFDDRDDRYVWLKGGLVVPVEPLILLLELERRGFRLSHRGDHLWICPASQLTDGDRVALRRWKPHVLLLIDHQPPEPEVH